MTTAKMIKARNRYCSGCELCLLTCSLVRTGTVNPRLARLRLAHEEDEAAHPVICVHCKKALCLEACQVPGAMELDSETGAIVIDDEKCTRCLDCIDACPFDAIWVGPDGEVLKCDLCGGEPCCIPGHSALRPPQLRRPKIMTCSFPRFVRRGMTGTWEAGSKLGGEDWRLE